MSVRVKREAAGISQAELARRIGMHQPKLSKIENGHVDPTDGELRLIEAALSEAAILSHPAVVDAVMPEVEAWESRGHYPAAPSDPVARRAWFERRNKDLQTRGVKSPASGSFGAQPKKPKV